MAWTRIHDTKNSPRRYITLNNPGILAKFYVLYYNQRGEAFKLCIILITRLFLNFSVWPFLNLFSPPLGSVLSASHENGNKKLSILINYYNFRGPWKAPGVFLKVAFSCCDAILREKKHFCGSKSPAVRIFNVKFALKIFTKVAIKC